SGDEINPIFQSGHQRIFRKKTCEFEVAFHLSSSRCRIPLYAVFPHLFSKPYENENPSNLKSEADSHTGPSKPSVNDIYRKLRRIAERKKIYQRFSRPSENIQREDASADYGQNDAD